MCFDMAAIFVEIPRSETWNTSTSQIFPPTKLLTFVFLSEEFKEKQELNDFFFKRDLLQIIEVVFSENKYRHNFRKFRDTFLLNFLWTFGFITGRMLSFHVGL